MTELHQQKTGIQPRPSISEAQRRAYALQQEDIVGKPNPDQADLFRMAGIAVLTCPPEKLTTIVNDGKTLTAVLLDNRAPQILLTFIDMHGDHRGRKPEYKLMINSRTGNYKFKAGNTQSEPHTQPNEAFVLSRLIHEIYSASRIKM